MVGCDKERTTGIDLHHVTTPTDDTDPALIPPSSPRNRPHGGNPVEDVPSIEATLLVKRLEADRPPEVTLAVTLPSPKTVEVKTLRLDELQQSLLPIFDGLRSPDVARQQAALRLIGTPFRSMKNAARRYETLVTAIMLWRIYASAQIQRDAGFSQTVIEARKARQIKFVAAVEDITKLGVPPIRRIVTLEE